MKDLDKQLLKESWIGDIDEVKFLLNEGADVNAKDINGYTAIIWAVRHNDKELIELLIQHKANISCKALDNARLKGYTGIVDLLKEHGAKG